MKTDVPWQVQRRRSKGHTCCFIQSLSYWTKTWFILFPTFHLSSFSYVQRFHFQSSPYLKWVQWIKYIFAIYHSCLLKRQTGDQYFELCFSNYIFVIFQAYFTPLTCAFCVNDLFLTWLIFSRDQVFIPLLFSFLSIKSKTKLFFHWLSHSSSPSLVLKIKEICMPRILLKKLKMHQISVVSRIVFLSSHSLRFI